MCVAAANASVAHRPDPVATPEKERSSKAEQSGLTGGCLPATKLAMMSLSRAVRTNSGTMSIPRTCLSHSAIVDSRSPPGAQLLATGSSKSPAPQAGSSSVPSPLVGNRASSATRSAKVLWVKKAPAARRAERGTNRRSSRAGCPSSASASADANGPMSEEEHASMASALKYWAWASYSWNSAGISGPDPAGCAPSSPRRICLGPIVISLSPRTCTFFSHQY